MFIKSIRHCISKQRLEPYSTMSCQAQGVFWLRHWSFSCRDIMICCICCVSFVEQINQELATEIDSLAQFKHSHPFRLCCCGLVTCSDAFQLTLLREKSSFFVSKFYPKHEILKNADCCVNHRILSCQARKLLHNLSNDTRMQGG